MAFDAVPVNAPTKVVAVVTPVVNIFPSGLNVIPEPTLDNPDDVIRSLSLPPALNNKSFAFVPPDFILAESPELAKNVSGLVA